MNERDSQVMRIEVTQTSGKKEVLVFPNSQVIKVGRLKKSDIYLEGEGISREHMTIECKKDKVYLLDLGSTNGVFVDGKRIPAFDTTIEFTTFFPVKVGLVASLALLSLDEFPEDTSQIQIEEKKPRNIEASYEAYRRKYKIPKNVVEEPVKVTTANSNQMLIIVILLAAVGVFLYFHYQGK